MENKLISIEASKHANSTWDVHENPNEHDNARDDFIAGVCWATEENTRDIASLFSFTNYVNTHFIYHDNTDKGNVYKDKVCDHLYSENDVYDEWYKQY